MCKVSTALQIACRAACLPQVPEQFQLMAHATSGDTYFLTSDTRNGNWFMCEPPGNPCEPCFFIVRPNDHKSRCDVVSEPSENLKDSLMLPERERTILRACKCHNRRNKEVNTSWCKSNASHSNPGVICWRNGLTCVPILYIPRNSFLIFGIVVSLNERSTIIVISLSLRRDDQYQYLIM